MTVGQQLRWWGIGVVVFILLLWLLSAALLPFVLGAAAAYLTDPVADRLQRAGMSRTLATVVITVALILIVVLVVVLIVPPLIEQVQRAIARAPETIERLKGWIATWLPTSTEASSTLRAALESLRERAQGWSLAVLKQLWSSGLALIDFVALVVLTPVVAFYLLLDWDRAIAWIDDGLPREHQETIRTLFRDLDRVLAGFARGQLIVCGILGTFYAVALSVIGLEFGLLIGAFAGLISFIPFAGTILGGVLSIGVALAQFWGEWGMIAAVAGVFVFGQVVEGNFLTPRLVGGQVGLHPVWLIFALSAFGSLFGFVGLLVAVPASAAIGVFGRFLVARYKEGPLYLGGAASEASGAPGPGEGAE